MSTWKMIGGLDPSLSNFGMSKGILINDSKIQINEIQLVTTKSNPSIKFRNMDDLERAKQLGRAMIEFFSDVDVIYVELPVGSQSSRAQTSYGVCIGVIAALGSRVKRVSAKDVKLVATGNPEASKQDMIDWATNLYPELTWHTKKRNGVLSYTGKNEHVADSIAAIHAGLKNESIIKT